MSNLIGTAPDQVPVNGMLGNLAFQDIDSVKITDLTYTGTLTGSTGILNIGSGQLYKDASGNVGIGTTAPSTKLTVAGATTISVTDNTNAALRITQLGTGNALVVEDSTNPDSTPFVIDASGKVFIGATTSAGSTSTGLAPRVQIVGTGATTGDANSTSTLGVYRFFNDTGGPIYAFFKSNSATPNTFASVNNNDTLGSIFWQADDGASFPRAASISAAVDGTPGTNDMPGRLVFATTADGASSPTERMRIDSYGSIGVGGSAGAAYTMHLLKNPTGATSTYGLRNGGTIQSDVTTQHNVFYSRPATAASTFTVGAINHYRATQGTIGDGSTVTAQAGFRVDSDLTGATNNYAFTGNIPSGTGRYNLYMAGTADNYLAGSLGIGGSDARAMVNVGGSIVTGTGIEYFRAGGTLPATATAYVIPFHCEVSTPASATTFSELTSFKSQPTTTGANSILSVLNHFAAAGPSLGSGASITNQYGFVANSGLTGATNNYGFYGNIASGTGRYNLYMAGTADNYMAGSLGIGTASLAGYNIRVSKTITGATTASVVNVDGAIQSDVTATVRYFNSYAQTAGTTWTLPSLSHYNAIQGTFGTTAVTTQNGVNIEATLVGATNNYAFSGNIPAATGRYNLYMGGTANNYLAGSLGIDSTALTGYNLRIGKNLTGLVDSVSVLNLFQINSDVTASATGFQTQLSTQAAAFTLSTVYHFIANALTIGAASAVTTQLGFAVGGSLTGATNNYGFYGGIASGTGRYNLYMSGTASNYFGGKIGIGTGAPFADTSGISVGNNLTGGTTQNAHNVYATISSDVTTTARGYNSQLQTTAAAFTLNTIHHFNATQIAIGAGSTVTNQYGFSANSSLTGATNNYGFYGGIPAGTGRYNLYMGGTADNYLAGNVGIGTNSPSSFGKFAVVGSNNGGAIVNYFSNSWTTPTANTQVVLSLDAGGNGYGVRDSQIKATNNGVNQTTLEFYTANGATPAERMRIDSSGNVVLKTGSLQEVKTALAALDINISLGNYFTKTISAISTLTVSNVPATGTVASFILDLTNGGAFAITWWANMKWASGTAPTLTASGRDILGFFTHDAGTTWNGLVLAKDIK